MISVLYVDDDSFLLETTKTFLSRNSSFSVDTALNAAQALELMRANQYDIIVSDYQMPGMDGIEFLQQLRGEGNDIPFIIFTGRGREDVVVDAYNAGADSYLVKGGDPKILFMDLARMIEQIVTRRSMERELRFTNILLTKQQEVTLDGILVVESGGMIFSCNRQFTDMWDIPAEHCTSKPWENVLRTLAGKLSNPATFLTNAAACNDNPGAIYHDELILTDTRTIDCYSASLEGSGDQIYGRIWFFRDITEQKRSEQALVRARDELEQKVLERTRELRETNQALQEDITRRRETERQLQTSVDEKTLLIKEVHHRVKNNLQIITSLLNLQSRLVHDEPTLAAIRESQNRIKVMALVHERLYKSENISKIDLRDYIKFLSSSLFQFYGAKGRGVKLSLEIHDIHVDINAAIPLGLIINELISNSLNYAFPDGRPGEIVISLTKMEGTLTIVYHDNGIGIPPDLDWKNTESLGLRLVNTLIDQMDGTIELDRSAGTRFSLVVHEKK